MAGIDKRPDGRYQARWWEGPQKTRHFDRKGDADRFLDAIQGDIAHGLYVNHAGGRALFQERADQWRVSPCIRIALPKKLDTR